MGKRLKPEDIKVISYVHVGDKLVNTEELDPEQRKRLGTELAIGWLNGLFQGKAIFYRKGEEPPLQARVLARGPMDDLPQGQ